jgi:hypothetical protein
MKCPICGNGELERTPGEQKLSGLLIRPDVLTCPTCKAQAEQRGDKLRFTFIPSPFAGVIGRHLTGFTPAQTAEQVGQSVRHFLDQRDAIASGKALPCQAPFPLKKKEECVYISPQPGTLYEQRTRQNQPYWAGTEQGTIVVTTLAVYVGHNGIPLSKIHSANLSTTHLDFIRDDRKRPQRLAFADDQAAHLVGVVLARLIPDVLQEPQLSSKPIKRDLSSFALDLSIPVSIPLGQGQSVKLPAYLALILTSVTLVLICILGRLAFVATNTGLRQVGMLPAYTPTPTQIFTPTTTRTPTSTPVPTDTPTPEPTDTPVSTPTAVVLPTATPPPLPTPNVTNLVSPQVQVVTAVNLRSGPGTLYPTVSSASIGDVLSVVGANQEGDWLQVTNDEGLTCWVSANSKYVQALVEGSLLDIPVVKVPPPPPTITPTPTPEAIPTATPTPPVAQRAPVPTSAPARACCKVCTTGKACGDSCIAANKNCNKGPGCACNAY